MLSQAEQDVAVAPQPLVFTQAFQASLNPWQVLQYLQDGNRRFMEGKMLHRDYDSELKTAAKKQYPGAVILSCIDSRTPPELIFDQGIGDMMAIRIAGNIVNNDILGSMEFAAHVIGVKLIAVIGHTRCGAVDKACQDVKLGHATALLEKIQPAVQQAKKDFPAGNCQNQKFVNEIAKKNVLLVMHQIKDSSPIIRKLITEGKIGIVGGIQDIETSKVVFLDDYSLMPARHADIK